MVRNLIFLIIYVADFNICRRSGNGMVCVTLKTSPRNRGHTASAVKQKPKAKSDSREPHIHYRRARCCLESGLEDGGGSPLMFQLTALERCRRIKSGDKFPEELVAGLHALAGVELVSA